MDAQIYYQLLDTEILPSESDINQFKKTIDEYPYFQSGIFIYLKALYLYDNDNYKEELARLSIFISDRKALFYYIFSQEYSQFFKQTGKVEITENKTDALLNAFFNDQDGNDNNLYLEFNLLNYGLASTDYLTYLEMENRENPKESDLESGDDTSRQPLKHQGIIDTFIEKSEEEGGIHIHIDKASLSDSQDEPEIEDDSTDSELNEDVFFTETLARIYIKQKKYDKAYKIIKHLSLNYPKKNIYFADQMSFLEKLIINSKFKDKN